MHKQDIPIALIPGINNSLQLWDSIISEFPAWIEAYPLDCPPLVKVEEIADKLLTALPERFCLCGFSFGGYVALAMLAKAPERISGLIMINSNAEADNASQIAARQQAIVKAEAGEYEALVNVQATKVFHPDSLSQDHIKQARLNMVREYGAEHFIAHLHACIARPDRQDLISRLSIPALIVAAEEDQVIPAASQKAMADVIPYGDYITIPKAGHMMPLEKPVELANKLIAWLDMTKKT